MEEPPSISRRTAVPLSSLHAARALIYDTAAVQDFSESQLEDNADLPNLTVFASEVAEQQRGQRETLEDLQHELIRLCDNVGKEKTNYQSVSAERLLWDQKIVLNKEAAIQSKSIIGNMKSELVHLMAIRKYLEEDGVQLGYDTVKSEVNNNDHITKMEEYRRATNEVEAKSKVFDEIAEAHVALECVKKEVCLFDNSSKHDSSPNAIREDIDKFANDKRRLEGILSNKRNQVREEEEKAYKKSKEQDAARNKLAAQKLRLRKQIERARNMTQQLRDEADLVRKQIWEVTS